MTICVHFLFTLEISSTKTAIGVGQGVIAYLCFILLNHFIIHLCRKVSKAKDS